MTIKSLHDVKPGDLMITGMNSAPTKITVYLGQWLLGQQFRIGKFVAAHVGIVDTTGRLIEAMPSGARRRDLTDKDWSQSHVYLRLPEDYLGQAYDAARVAEAMVGIPYSLLSYVYLSAYLAGFRPEWLARHINRRQGTYPPQLSDIGPVRDKGLPVEAICSVLAEQAWTLTGYDVIHGTKPQVVTPGMLAAQLWTRDGVTRGGMMFEQH